MENNENQEVVNNATEEVGTQANANKDEVKAEETFTQEQVNSMIKKEKDKIINKYKDINIEDYNNWVESQKTAEQKQAEKDAENLKKDETISSLKKENAILKAGVKDEEDIDYILFKVNKLEGDFSENLAKFLQEHPKYTNNQELTNEPKATGAPVQVVGSSKEDGITAILKAKHPELNFK